MFVERWFYDFLIYLYALSLLMSFSDLLYPNVRSRRLSMGLLIAVWIIQSTSFIVGLFSFWTITSPLDARFIFSWTLVTFTLVMHGWYRRIDLLIFCANVMGFVILVFHVFTISNMSYESAQMLLTELGFVHISLSILSYAAFSLSSICSSLYLLNNYLLKKKKWNRLLRRLPSLDRLQVFSRNLLLVGIPLFFIAMLLGFMWIYQLMGYLFWNDLKILFSIFVFLFYGFILTQWVRNRWHVRRIAWWNSLAILTIFLNMFVSGLPVSFHYWF